MALLLLSSFVTLKISILEPSSCGFKNTASKGLNLSKCLALNLASGLSEEGNLLNSDQSGVFILFCFRIFFVSFLFHVFLQHFEPDPEYKIFKSSKHFCSEPPSPSKP